ncbi:hypothetical protein LDENG_00186110 [Lucifuga dentata]|nr:hypothetical protein LDENG_00186110 [Lucifuga dentata]
MFIPFSCCGDCVVPEDKEEALGEEGPSAKWLGRGVSQCYPWGRDGKALLALGWVVVREGRFGGGRAQSPGEESGTKERFRKRNPRKHISNTHAYTDSQAGRIPGYTLQAVAEERLICSTVTEEVVQSDMIPHEIFGAHSVSRCDSVFSCLKKPGAVQQ